MNTIWNQCLRKNRSKRGKLNKNKHKAMRIPDYICNNNKKNCNNELQKWISNKFYWSFVVSVCWWTTIRCCLICNNLFWYIYISFNRIVYQASYCHRGTPTSSSLCLINQLCLLLIMGFWCASFTWRVTLYA